VIVSSSLQSDPPFDSSFEVEANEEHAEARTARFLAWPIGLGARVRSTDAAATWPRLRERAESLSSNIALVIDEAVLGVQRTLVWDTATELRVVELRQRCAHLGEHADRVDGRLRKLLQALTSAPPSAKALPWLELGANEAWIVPRLGSLHRIEQLARELEAVEGVHLVARVTR
jgi:hypothetical protein